MSKTSMASENTPENTSISPSNMKRGIGRRMKVEIEENKVLVNCINPGPPPHII
jgi:hypothetical protein